MCCSDAAAGRPPPPPHADCRSRHIDLTLELPANHSAAAVQTAAAHIATLIRSFSPHHPPPPLTSLVTLTPHCPPSPPPLTAPQPAPQRSNPPHSRPPTGPHRAPTPHRQPSRPPHRNSPARSTTTARAPPTTPLQLTMAAPSPARLLSLPPRPPRSGTAPSQTASARRSRGSARCSSMPATPSRAAAADRPLRRPGAAQPARPASAHPAASPYPPQASARAPLLGSLAPSPTLVPTSPISSPPQWPHPSPAAHVHTVPLDQPPGAQTAVTPGAGAPRAEMRVSSGALTAAGLLIDRSLRPPWRCATPPDTTNASATQDSAAPFCARPETPAASTEARLAPRARAPLAPPSPPLRDMPSAQHSLAQALRGLHCPVLTGLNSLHAGCTRPATPRPQPAQQERTCATAALPGTRQSVADPARGGLDAETDRRHSHQRGHQGIPAKPKCTTPGRVGMGPEAATAVGVTVATNGSGACGSGCDSSSSRTAAAAHPMDRNGQQGCSARRAGVAAKGVATEWERETAAMARERAQGVQSARRAGHELALRPGRSRCTRSCSPRTPSSRHLGQLQGVGDGRSADRARRVCRLSASTSTSLPALEEPLASTGQGRAAAGHRGRAPSRPSSPRVRLSAPVEEGVRDGVGRDDRDLNTGGALCDGFPSPGVSLSSSDVSGVGDHEDPPRRRHLSGDSLNVGMRWRSPVCSSSSVDISESGCGSPRLHPIEWPDLAIEMRSLRETLCKNS